VSITSGLRSGLQSGIRSGVNPSYGGATWSLDATSNKALPANATEANAILAAAGVSGSTVSLYLFGAPASGNVSDGVGGKTLTATGTLAYQQTVSGWAAKSLNTTGGAAGIAQNNTFSNVNAAAYTIYFYAQLAIEGGTRTIMKFGDLFDDDACIEQSAASRLVCGEGDGTRTTGGSDPTGQVRPYALSVGANVVVANDLETIAVGTRACNGTTLVFGGDNTQTNLPGSVKYLLGWVVDATHSSVNIKAVFQAAGWTVPW
jgi:hypothetical protein